MDAERITEQVQPVRADRLRAFCQRVFETLNVPAEDAAITADVLVAANLRGVDSHGVARLRRYVNGLRDGMMVAKPKVQVVCETPTTATIDAGAGLGQPVSYRAMQRAIQKARDLGSGFVTVRNSNHYGIAGYYAMMALEHDCIGISMTNADVLVVPTFGRNAVLGTNPIAVAAPASQERPFVLDMATSTVPRGKLEVYQRLGKPMPLGWATDETGTPTTDAGLVLENFKKRAGGGLLPLGGAGELMGGHKGYGLALLVDVLCAVLSGAAYADLVYPKTPDGKPLPSNIGHFFGVWRVDAFRPVEEFKAAMDDLQRRLKNSPKAEGQPRIYIHGEKEYEEAERRSREGIVLEPKVVADLRAIAVELGVEYDLE
ncbi:MAG: Ldh family oxidoreductase [Anaerolineae bacterium]|nr:Ldh family oxidoreductase [Anaerolineae bacterium]MDH7473246.1 Ldh family oxidoreductase [Anaerolineae bacterium]